MTINTNLRVLVHQTHIRAAHLEDRVLYESQFESTGVRLQRFNVRIMKNVGDELLVRTDQRAVTSTWWHSYSKSTAAQLLHLNATRVALRIQTHTKVERV